ncbi:MAG: hypothetical protein O9346_07895 [Leptospiraceae bacterium]|nr:hypothetical protein [Leptospiraceae bacterium]MCZ8346322.1 hypothetical protein [Leptospiraceae bacterium]
MKKYNLLFLSTLLLLSSCNFENYITVYYSEIVDFLADKTKENYTLPIKVKLELGGEESCNKDKGDIYNLLKPYFVDLQEGSCSRSDMKTYLEMKGKFQMVKDEATLDDTNYLVAFNIRESAKFIDIFVKLNSSSLNQINNYTKEKYWTKFQNKDLFVEIDFINDSKENKKITCRSCYLDGNPKPFFGFVEVKPKESTQILLSTILVEYILSEKPEPVFTINK